MAFTKALSLAVLTVVAININVRTANGFKIKHPVISGDKVHQLLSALVSDRVPDEPFNYLWYFLDLPLTLGEIGTFGDDVGLPSFVREDTRYDELLDVRKPRAINASSVKTSLSMDGTTLHISVNIPSLELQCEECLVKYTEYPEDGGFEPKAYWKFENFTWAFRDYQVNLTAELVIRDYSSMPGSLALENLDVNFSPGELVFTAGKGSREFLNGSLESLTNYRKDISNYLEAWYDKDHSFVITYIQDIFLNCLLSSGTSHYFYCYWFGEEDSSDFPLGFAKLLHGIGFAATKKVPEIATKAITDDPYIDTVNKILFSYGSPLIQSLFELYLVGRREALINFPISFERLTKNCTEDGSTCVETLGSMSITGKNTTVVGAQSAPPEIFIGSSRINYYHHIPLLQLKSGTDDYKRNSTNLNTGTQSIQQGMELTMRDVIFGIRALYSEVEGSIQLRDLKVTLELAELSRHIPIVSVIENGQRTELPPIDDDIAPFWTQLWEMVDESGETLQTRYSKYIEDNINDFLAGRISV